MFKKEEEEKPLLKKNIINDVSQFKMKPGEYELHLLIESTSGLFSDDKTQDLDVIITASTFGKKQHSKVKQKVGYEQTFWGEHFFFRKTFQDSSVAQGQRLTISVNNHKLLLKDSLIGDYQLDIGRIYAQKNHCIKHKWLALSNLQKKFSQVAGYLKISVAITGQNDNNIELQVEPVASITKQKNVLIPPNITRKSYQLIVQIYQGINIVRSNGKTADPYVGVEFGQTYQKTDPVMKITNPKYYKGIYIPLATPAVNDDIAIRINDFHYLQKIGVLGSYYINLNTLIEQSTINQKKKQLSEKGSSQKSIKLSEGPKKVGPLAKQLSFIEAQWINFYGPQSDCKNEQHKNIYQFFPKIAPYYIGSILLRAYLRENDDPQRKMIKIKADLPKMPQIYYRLTAQIVAGINLYNKNKKYKISVRFGQYQTQTDYSQCKNGFCTWGVQKSISVGFYQNMVVPDIFVYLIDHNGDKVCFQRFSPFKQDGSNANLEQITVVQSQWILLKPDLSKQIIQNQEAGYLKIGINIRKVQDKKQPQNTKVMRDVLSRIQSSDINGKIVVQLISAESLIPLDQEGSIDSFFTFSFMNSEITSSVKNQSLNPIFFEKLIIQTDINNNEDKLPPIIVNAYDQDKFSKEFLGATFIDIKQGLKKGYVVFGQNGRPKPKWFTIKQNDIDSGRFLASFILFRDKNTSIPKTIDIPKRKYVITLLILGLRGLKSNGLLAVNKPYIQFDYQSLNLFTDSVDQKVTRNVITQAKQSGNSVNIKTINRCVVLLPEDQNYWPSLSAKVKDYVLQGVYQPTLGYFSMNLAQAYKNTKLAKEKWSNDDIVLDNKKKIAQSNINQRLKGINPILLANLRNVIIKALNYSWPVMQKNIKLNDLKTQKDRLDPFKVVVFPTYQVIEEGKRYQEIYKEIIEKNGQYMKVGFDNNKSRAQKSLFNRNKHYRYCLDSTLEEYDEKSTGAKIGLYDQYQIRRGRVYPSNDIASNLIRKVSEQDGYVGKYKGNCFIVQQNNVDLNPTLAKKQQDRLRNYLKQAKFHMYLYVLEAFNIPQKDYLSKSDPYLIIRLGDKVLNFSKDYIENTNNPQFNKKIYELVQFPRQSVLQIEVWDYDPIGGDDLIGIAYVDLQNRAFYQDNYVTFNNPIETHKLTVKQSKISQGSIRFWIDLVSTDKISLYREFQIANQNQGQFQIRIIVWGCSDVPTNDFQDMSDLYVAVTFQNQIQQTDTHFRTSSGCGSYNWRCVFPVKLPTDDTYINFKVYDKDLLTGNDYLCSGTLSIKDYLQEAFQTDSGLKLYLGTEDLAHYSGESSTSARIIDGVKMYDRFQVQLKSRKDQNKDDKNQVENTGKVQISIQILPKSVVQTRKAGLGRQAPNQYPFLPQPKDRFQFSWNPVVLLSRMCGRAFKYKIAIALILVAIILLIYNFGHSFGGGLLANSVN